MEESRETMEGVIGVAAKENISHEISFKDALMVSIATGLGYGFDSYAVNIYGLILPVIAASLGAGSWLMGLIGSSLLVGYTIGTIGFGIAADNYHRYRPCDLSLHAPAFPSGISALCDRDDRAQDGGGAGAGGVAPGREGGEYSWQG